MGDGTMFENAEKNLKARGFSVKVFATAAEAGAYLNAVIDGTTVGIGGSVTVQEMDLKEMLSAHNEVFWHWTDGPEAREKAALANVYITSVNALAETGELINIDGTGNRVASTLYGHKKVYFIVGWNKLAHTYDEALWRARNIAAPKNAQRLGRDTPCAVNADRCYDCSSPDRICRSLVVLWEPMLGTETEVILVEEAMGY